MKKSFVPIMESLRKKLIQHHITMEVVAIAASGSIYLKFRDIRLGKIRISDHEERSSYGYKWQLRSDISSSKVISNKGHKQFFYPTSDIDSFVTHVKNYYNIILKNEKGPKHIFKLNDMPPTTSVSNKAR